MVNGIFAPLIRPKRAVGVMVTMLPESQLQVSVCVLRRKADVVVLEAQFTGLESLAALADLGLDSNAPLAVVVAGRGVVHKTLAPHQVVEYDPASALAMLLPGAREADFHLQQVTGSSYQHLALIRRNTLAALLQELHQQGRYVTQASLGPFGFAALLPYLADKSRYSYRLAGYELHIDGQQLTAVRALSSAESETAPVTIGEEVLAPALLLPYAAALTVLTNSAPITFPAAPVLHDRDEWEQKQLFWVGGISALAGFLTALLINFFAFSYLSSQNQALASQGAVNRSTLTGLEHLRQSVARKQQFLAGAGWLQSTRHSVRADELAASIPPGLQLLTLDSEPLLIVPTSQQQRPVFGTGTLRVKGQCQEAQTLNGWLQQISRLKWVESVREQNYAYDYSTGTGTFTFTIHTAQVPPQKQ